MPKPREVYAPLEKAIQPSMPSVLTAEDGPYWKAVRQAAAPCFSNSNLKNVSKQARQGSNVTGLLALCTLCVVLGVHSCLAD